MDYYVELDIGEIVGQDVVNRWREELKELNIYDKCVTVYHPKVMSEKDFIDMLDESESRYVGLEGLRENKSNLPYKKLIKLCYDRNVRVHGFAMIRDVWLDSVPFTSVDSVSWKAGAMYGTAMVKKPKGKITAVRLKSKHQMVKNGLSLMEYHKQTKEEQRFLLAMTAIESYKEKEKYFTDLWNKRGIYWDE